MKTAQRYYEDMKIKDHRSITTRKRSGSQQNKKEIDEQNENSSRKRIEKVREQSIGEKIRINNK